MNAKTAIAAFAQSEKIKSGVIWAMHLVEMLAGIDQKEKPGAEKSIRALILMMGHESTLTRRATADDAWVEIEKDLDMAVVMIDSGVAHEAAFHLGRALRRATGIGGRAMSLLIEQGLL
jgi:hypothetical protein